MKKTIELQRECPFEYLRPKGSNEVFPKEVVENWYMARAFVLNELNKDEIAFGPGCDDHLHAIVAGDSPLMLAVVRQLALSAHFINFVEYDPFGDLVCKNRTIITLVSSQEASAIVDELEKEENLCNLLKYCKYSVYGKVMNENSYIDVELEIKKEVSKDEKGLRITEEMVRSFIKSKKEDEVFKIDTRKAVYASRAYNLGVYIKNVPYEGIFSSDRYSHALNRFQYKLLEERDKDSGKGLVHDNWEKNLTAVKEGLSNLFCADCFEIRKKEIEKIKRDKKTKIRDVWKMANPALSLSEHSRWVVEKLIMGYRPWNNQERLKYESFFGQSREAYVKKLKSQSSDPAHIDLCSYRDVHRVDPDNLKYDSFLMLAIPLIFAKIQKDDSR